jgi:hypothetical protein
MNAAVKLGMLSRFHDKGIRIVDGLLELVVIEEHVQASCSLDHQQQKGDYKFLCGDLSTLPEKKFVTGELKHV